MLPLATTSELSERVLAQVERAIVGKRDALELVLLGILGDGHVLIDDFPGLAKTLIARSFAQVTNVDFQRVQFTPDLLPADITGSAVSRSTRPRSSTRSSGRSSASATRSSSCCSGCWPTATC